MKNINGYTENRLSCQQRRKKRCLAVIDHRRACSATLRELGELPLMTISSCLPSFRLPDHLILTATRFAGVPAFIERIAVEALPNLANPLKTRLAELL